MSDRGWYCGDSHVHLQTGGPIAASPADALLIARAEGIHYLNLCVSNNLGDDLRGADLITGRPHDVSTAGHLILFGEEMRSTIYGHMQFFGIQQLVEPQYTGFDNTPNHLDFPCNFTLAKAACDQGGVVTYGHPMLKNAPDAFATKLTDGNGAARELPVDAALGVVHAVDLMSYNCDKDLSTDLWYRLLNCGLKLAACVGTDALLDRSTDPAGGARVYVHLDGPLSAESWHAGLRGGATFVTNGPMLELLVDGQPVGSQLSMSQPGQVTIDARLDSRVGVDHLELIASGKVVHRFPLDAPTDPADTPTTRHYRFAHRLALERSGWLALRARGPDDPDMFDGPAWAHTSPVYVEVAGKAIRVPEDTQFFVQWIDKLLAVIDARNRYPSPADRESVEKLYRQAQQYYRTPAD